MSPKEEYKKYEVKIAELHTQVENEARELSKIQDRQVQANADLRLANSEHERIRREVATQQKKSDQLDKQIARAETLLDNLSLAHRGRSASLKADISSLTRQKLSILAFLSKKKQELKGIERHETKTKRNVLRLQKQHLALQPKIEAARKIISQSAAATKDLRIREQSIDEKIARDSRMRAETEKNLRTLEHYVKRLQRRYDKDGIKIDLLSQFAIKRDNK